MVRNGLSSTLAAENEEIRQANEREIQPRLEAMRKEFRLMPTPEMHNHEAAYRERQAAKQAARLAQPHEKQVAAGLISPRIRRTRSAAALAGTLRGSLQAVGRSSAPRDRETERLMFDAMRRWLEGIDETMRQSTAVVETLLSHQEDLLRRYGHRVAFNRDCRELGRAIDRASRDQSRWPMSLLAEDKAQVDLEQSRWELGQLDAKRARSSLWTKREWAQRRREQEQRVAERKQARDQARAATGPEAQVRYSRDVHRSLGEVERIAARMAKVYAVEPVSPQLPEVSETDDENGEQKLIKRPKTTRPPQSKLH
jgi:hypothetical protein